MEKWKMTYKAKFTAALLLAVLSFTEASGQQVVHDDQKQKQWRSMENGGWDFAPGWYYYLMHKGYSGAYTKWEWHGLKSGFYVHFDENKSKIKRVMPTRVLEEETQRQKLGKATEERVDMEAQYRQELEFQADRVVDLAYADYSDDFNHMQDVIADGLIYCLERSNGELAPAVDIIKRENELVCEAVAYIHRTGVGYELENSKRQQAYEEQRQAMQRLVRRTAKLAKIAYANYKTTNKTIDGNYTVCNGSANH